jgi:carboxypeptidase PM20D1
MLRWLFIFFAIVLPLGAFMAWRTAELKAPAAPVAARIIAPAPGAPVDLARAEQHLSHAIQFRTVAGDDGAPRDPATFLGFESWLTSTYAALGAAAKIERVADYSLLYTWQGSDAQAAPILLLAHLDVAADPGAATFSGAMRGGAIWGRGAQIGKSPLIALLEAADALAASGFKPKRTIIFAFGHDGDVRGEAGAAQIARLLKARGVKAWFALDEGPPAVSLNPLTGKASVLIGVTEKRDLDLVVTAAAPAGAAAVRGQQAVTMLAEAIVALDSMPNAASLSDQPTHDMMRALAADMPYSRAFVIANAWAFEPLILMQMRNSPGAEDLLSTTVSPTIVQGGDNQTLKPAEARATINVRLHPRDTPQGFLARARMIVSAFPGVTVAWESPPGPPIPIASDTSDAYRLIAAVAGDGAGHAAVAPSLYIGSTDARHYDGVARDAYRFTPAIWSADDIRNVMGPNEHLSGENFARMIAFYRSLIVEAAR